MGGTERVRVLFIAAAIGLLSCTACARPPLRIGYIGSITGRQSALGLEGMQAVELAVSELNAAGGIGGRLVELIVRDDRNDRAAVADGLRELEAMPVAAVIGPSTSDLALAAVGAVPGSSVPVVAGTVSSAAFTGERDSFFRVINDVSREAALAGEYLLGSRRADTLLPVYDASNSSYSRLWCSSVAASFSSAGGRALPSVSFDSASSVSYGAVAEAALAALAGAGRDGAVAIAAGGVDTALIAQALRKRGFTGQLLSSAWGKTPDVLINGGDSVDGMIFFENYDPSSRSPRFLAFYDEFARRYGRPPNFSAVNHYEAALLLFEGLRIAARDGIDPLSALRAVSRLDGLQAEIAIDEYGDAARGLFLLEVHDGAFRSVGP